MQLYINPFISIFFSLLLILGVFKIGQVFYKLLPLKFPNKSLIYINFILGIAFLSVFVNWATILIQSPKIYIVIAASLIMFAVSYIADIIKKNPAKLVCFQKWNFILTSIFILEFLFFLANFGHVTNADSIDYHMGYASNYLKEPFLPYADWYQGRLAQSGEKLIAVGLSIETQIFAQLIQFFSMISIVGLIYSVGFYKNHLNETFKYFLLAFASSPIFLFLGISAKPSLVASALTALSFLCLILLYFENSIFNIKHKKFLLCLSFLLSLVAATFKFNFMIQLVLVGIACTYLAYRNRLVKFFFIAGTILFLFIFSPVYLDKYIRYNTSIIEFFFSPISSFDRPLQLFTHHSIIGYHESSFLFPFYIIIPSSFNIISTVIGVGIIYALFRFLFFDKTNPFFILIILYISILFFFGQPASRFYLEPFIWSSLLISFFGISFKSKMSHVLKFATFIQFITVIISISFFVFPVLHSLTSKKNEDLFLEKYAYGFALHKWIGNKLPKDEPVLLDHRSRYFSNRPTITSWPLIYRVPNDKGLQDYKNTLESFHIKYAVTTSESPLYNLFLNCNSGILAGPELIKNASRNPFNRDNFSIAYIFIIEPDKFINCSKYIKVPYKND